MLTLARPTAIINKIHAINSTKLESGQQDTAIPPEELASLKSLRAALEAVPARANDVTPSHVAIVEKIITRWTGPDKLAGLDLVRCMAISPLVTGHPAGIVKAVSDAALDGDDGNGKVLDNCAMMAVRTVANLFVTDNGRRAAAAQMDYIAMLLNRVLGLGGKPALGRSNRNMQLAMTTALVNLSVFGLRSTGLRPVARAQVMTMLKTVLLDEEQTDEEVVFRALVALGTLIAGGAVADRGTGEVIEVRGWVDKVKQRMAATDERVMKVVDECMARLK